jgi:drug/metabolite transporter (DMT)-like permease
MIMGALDCMACSMQIFASVYLPGPLLVLLPQAAIPISMVLSRYLLRERFHWTQYLGAIVVLLGILVVLEPVATNRHSPDFYCEAIDVTNDCTVCVVERTQESCLSHKTKVDPLGTWMEFSRILGSTNRTEDISTLCRWLPSSEAARDEEYLMFGWSFVVIASCIPMTLSTIYKEIVLGDGTELDPIFLNGWIAIFQLFFSVLLAVPAGMVSSPAILPSELPGNVWDGLRCYIGRGSVGTGCHPDEMCSFHAAFLVNLTLFANIMYTFFMMYVLKYGSTALVFLALTVMVPSK